ncbi:MAG: hypothetical protein PWP24_799 [Clostridiales bacterium]|nr:hypothetical protein [Clostridiales bacterium]
MNESSFSLLNQKEIDTLISFLSEKEAGVTREVLSQDSIDKLIHLISDSDINKIRLDALDSLELKPTYDILKELHIRTEDSELCELQFYVDADTQFVNLTAINTITKQQYTITPATLDRAELINASSSWGYSIAPILFDKVARIFHLKYSRQTYEEVCMLFMDKNFGQKEQRVPSFYSPSTYQLLENLL